MALFSAASQRINGDSQAHQELVILQNARGSQKIVNVKRILSQMDATNNTTAISAAVLTYRGTTDPLLDGACAANKCAFDTTATSDPKVQMWYAVTPDGDGWSNMDGTAGTMAWRQWAMRRRTAVGQVLAYDNSQLPALVATNNWRLYPGEYLMVRADPIANADNSNTNGWFVQAVWEETTLPMHTISGVVTNSAVGVVGAKVTVMIGDDSSLTNLILWEVVTTTAGGAWTCQVPDGKLAFAQAQNYSAGTYYTATGKPYIS